MIVVDLLTNLPLLGYVLLGTTMGLIFGSLPGLTATMGVALLVPVTFSLDATAALGMLLGVYVGGIAGGAVSAILLNIPGTPSSVVTTLDGFPMAQKGQGAKALGWAVTASFVGGFLSWAVLVCVAPQLARFALSFGPPEYAGLALFGLTIIASISGKSLLKGIVAGLIGIALSFVGVDGITGDLRFTFGEVNLMSGIAIMPALIGFFAIPEILQSLTAAGRVLRPEINLKELFPSLRELKAALGNLVRSSIIGTLVGIVPATGGNVASFLAYDQARRTSKDPESFGKGNYQGVVASEAANNGVTGGALIPLLTLGIPGDSVTAVLLGGLMIHGLQPGPNLFTENANIVYGIFVTLLVANIFMAAIQFVGIRGFVQILRVPTHYLAPVLLTLAIVGSYALNNSVYDVWVMLFLGTFGYIMTLGGFPMAPIVLGLVLGPILESELRRSLIMSAGDWSIFVTRPITVVFLILSVAVAAGPTVMRWLRQARSARSTPTRGESL